MIEGTLWGTCIAYVILICFECILLILICLSVHYIYACYQNRKRSWNTFSISYYRVNYRKEQLDVKIAERKLKEEQKAEDELEKERRLEALREQVRLISTWFESE